MGGNPGAVGNGLHNGLAYPPTEYVADVRKVERALLYSQIPGQRNWEEVLRAMFKEDYSDNDDLKAVVSKSMERIKNRYVPVRVMDRYREEETFNRVTACK